MTSIIRTIHVGSVNPVKLRAVQEAMCEDWGFSTAEVRACEADSGVSDQPTSLDETIRGATNRARRTFAGSDLSVGLEDGLLSVPYTQSGYMNICACALFDGDRDYIGLAPAFEYPIEVVRLVIEEGLDITQAFLKAELSDNATLGSAEGAIGVLSHGRLTRKDYTKHAVDMALIHFTRSTERDSI